MLLIQRGHISAPAAMGPLWEGLGTSLLEPGPGPGPGPPVPPPLGGSRLAAWPQALKIQFWRLGQTITFPYMLPTQRGHISAPAAMGPLWEGLGTSLLEPGPGPGPGPPVPEPVA